MRRVRVIVYSGQRPRWMTGLLVAAAAVALLAVVLLLFIGLWIAFAFAVIATLIGLLIRRPMLAQFHDGQSTSPDQLGTIARSDRAAMAQLRRNARGSASRSKFDGQ